MCVCVLLRGAVLALFAGCGGEQEMGCEMWR